MVGREATEEVRLMRVLLDTNILLDHLLQRAPWAEQAAAIWQAVDQGRLRGHVTATVITDVFYIARRHTDLATAHAAVRICLATFEVITVDRYALQQALTLPGSDFEDNVQIACAVIAELDALVTRDPGGFRASPVPVLSPAELLQRLR